MKVAGDGQEAIDLLAAAGDNGPGGSAPGLVLLDLNLPRRTGFDVLNWIRRESRWKTVIVIVLTSSSAASDVQKAYTLGANSFLVKPTDATKLREVVQLLKSYWLSWNQG